jgi:iron complex outermembrane receptor protein
MLLYAKYSTAYVSGGSTAGIPFEAETAKSAEVGMKAEFLNRKLRANLAAFWVQYKNVQTPQTATSFAAQIAQITGDPNLAASIGTFVLTTGDLTAKGFEFDFDAAPADGVTIGGSLSYNQRSIKNVPQLLITANDGAFDAKRGVPEWTGSVYAQYKTRPLFGESYLSLRADGVWTDDVANDSNPNRPIYSVNPAAYSIKSYWMVNGRVALRDIDIGGVKTEIALWGRNLFDTQRLSYGLNLSNIFFAGNYLPARTMGVDLTVSF